MSDTTSSNPSTKPESEDVIDEAEVVEEAPESDAPVMIDIEEGEAEAPSESIVDADALPASSETGYLKPLLGVVAGGALAAGAGFFAAAQYWPQNDQGAASQIALLSETVVEQQTALERLEQSDAAHSDALAANTLRIEAIPGTEDLAADVTALREALRRIEARVDALETRPLAEINPDGAAALQAQLEAFRQELNRASAEADAKAEAARVEAEQIKAAAVETAKAADRNAALAELKIALDTGVPLSDALGRLREVPPDLEAVADGAPTLAALQSEYPDAARAVLAASSQVPDSASTTERFTAFLKRQTNARSLTPKTGEDTDAVLSRAEAFLRNGDLTGSLDELQALPEAAQEIMADWLSSANKRAAAIAAYAEIAATN